MAHEPLWIFDNSMKTGYTKILIARLIFTNYFTPSFTLHPPHSVSPLTALRTVFLHSPRSVLKERRSFVSQQFNFRSNEEPTTQRFIIPCVEWIHRTNLMPQKLTNFFVWCIKIDFIITFDGRNFVHNFDNTSKKKKWIPRKSSKYKEGAIGLVKWCWHCWQ